MRQTEQKKNRKYDYMEEHTMSLITETKPAREREILRIVGDVKNLHQLQMSKPAPQPTLVQEVQENGWRDEYDGWKPVDITKTLHRVHDLDLEISSAYVDLYNPEIEDRWDYTYIAGRQHVSTFWDMLNGSGDPANSTEDSGNGMLPIPDGDDPDWRQNPDLTWLVRELAKANVRLPFENPTQAWFARACLYDWNDDFFTQYDIKRHLQLGRVWTSPFVTFPDGTRYAACVVKRMKTTGPQYVAVWRQNLGTESILVRGKRRNSHLWSYEASKTFVDHSNPIKARAAAQGFANRLITLARTEAQLQRDADSAAQGASYWHDQERPMDPDTLDGIPGFLQDRVSSSEAHITNAEWNRADWHTVDIAT